MECFQKSLVLSDVATFLLDKISLNDALSLSLVEKEILCGPPVAYISRKVYNGVKRLRSDARSDLPALWDFVEKLVIEKPNLHTLDESLKNVDINTLELRWTYPFVYTTSHPSCVNLSSWTKNLAVLRIREDAQARLSLSLFRELTIPDRLKLFDLEHVHVLQDETDDQKQALQNLAKILMSSKCNVMLCECLLDAIEPFLDISETTITTRKWTIFNCSFKFTLERPYNANY